MKKSTIYASLIALTIWPVFQIYLTKAYALSPWKLAGWGMYAAPRIPNPGLELEGRRDRQGAYQPISPSTFAIRDAAHEYLREYYWLRDLIAPDEVATAIFRVTPQAQQVRIRVFRPEMDPRSGMIEKTSREYEYTRGQ